VVIRTIDAYQAGHPARWIAYGPGVRVAEVSMERAKRRVLALSLAGVVLLLLVSCGPPPLSEWIIGTWAGVVAMPGYGDLYMEASYEADGSCSSLAYDSAGGTLLDDMSLRGTYVVSGDQLTATFGEMWWAGEWHPHDPAVTSTRVVDEAALNGNSWTFDLDFDEDGVVDATWTLTRQ